MMISNGSGRAQREIERDTHTRQSGRSGWDGTSVKDERMQRMREWKRVGVRATDATSLRDDMNGCNERERG